MNSCEFIVQISAIACALAKGKSEKEIALLSSLFSQISSSLATMLTYHEACCKKEDTDTTNTEESNGENILTTP